MGGGGKQLRSESHFHVMGAVHTLEVSRERPESDFSKYISQAKQLPGSEWRLLTRDGVPHVPILQWERGEVLRLTLEGDPRTSQVQGKLQLLGSSARGHSRHRSS